MPPDDEFTTATVKTEVLMSNYLADERTKINGAFFLAIGIILSYNFFNSVSLVEVYQWTQILTVLLLVMGIYEAYVLLKSKLPIVVSFYTYYNISKYTELLKKAIQRKDWIEAEKIRDKEPDSEEEYPDFDIYRKIPTFGICLKCKVIHNGSYCSQCGEKIVKYCPSLKCNATLISEENEPFPAFCKYCGKKIG